MSWSLAPAGWYVASTQPGRFMLQGKLDHLQTFLVIARERSFTKAAAQLGLSQSALSHAVRDLEARLGVQLLARTTRSVAPTEAGERLIRTLEPCLGEIEGELQAIAGLRRKPAGSLRITAGDHAVRTVLWPKLAPFMRANPDIHVELMAENGLTDIVAQRFDAGVRFGEQLEKDMIAVRVGPDMRFSVVAAPACLAGLTRPVKPEDLVEFPCINMRFPTLGGLYAWEFERGGENVKVRVQGRLVFNQIFQVLDAALAGFGLAYVPDDIARPHVLAGELVRVLDEWCPTVSGYHLYYPTRRQQSSAFAMVLNALRHQG